MSHDILGGNQRSHMLRCICGREGNAGLMVYGRLSSIRVAVLCQACYENTQPLDECQVDAVTISDMRKLLAAVLRRLDSEGGTA